MFFYSLNSIEMTPVSVLLAIRVHERGVYCSVAVLTAALVVTDWLVINCDSESSRFRLAAG